MRKIRTRDLVERKKRTNTIIISSLILALLLISTVGFAFITSPDDSSNDNVDYDYSNKSNIKVDSKLKIDYLGKTFYLSSSASDIENISVDIDALPEDYSGRVLYVSSNSSVALRELMLMNGIYSRIQEACYGSCEDNLPEKNCDGEDNLIVLRNSLEDKVWQKDKCLFIEGGVRAVDAFIYNLFEGSKESSLLPLV